MMAAMAANRVEIACTLLINWLWATCTQVQLANGVALDASPLVQAPPVAPLVDEDLLKHQWALIALDLPVLDPNQLQHRVPHISTSIGTLAMETHLVHKEAFQAQGARENWTIKCCFWLNTMYILRYCQVQMQDELLPVWAEIVCMDKAQILAAIQQVMEAASYKVTERECKFQVTTSLATKITLLQQWKSMEQPSQQTDPFSPGAMGLTRMQSTTEANRHCFP